MDINDLFDGFAETFRYYQTEMTEQVQPSTNPAPIEFDPQREPEKTEKIISTEKVFEQNFLKRK